MATHSTILAWRIPGTQEPSGLPSVVAQSRTRLKRLSSSSRSNVWKVLVHPLLVSPNVNILCNLDSGVESK